MQYVTTDAIVLRSKKTGERDKLVSFLTRDHGKMMCLVRGISKTGHKYGSAIELFSLQHIMFCRARAHARATLTSATLVDAQYALRTDMQKFCAASFFVDAVDTFVAGEGGVGHEVFDILANALTCLALDDTTFVGIWFVFRLLDVLGHRVICDVCAGCGSSVETLQEMVLAPSLGGVVCSSCHTHKRIHGTRITATARRVLAALLQCHTYENARPLIEHIDAQTKAMLREVAWHFIVYFSDGKIKMQKRGIDS